MSIQTQVASNHVDPGSETEVMVGDAGWNPIDFLLRGILFLAPLLKRKIAPLLPKTKQSDGPESEERIPTSEVMQRVLGLKLGEAYFNF